MERTKRLMTLLLAVLLALTAVGGAALAEDKPEMRKLSVICVVLDAPNDIISALSGKLGRLSGVKAKAQYAK